MGAPERMEAAKGAVLGLLTDAYRRRDLVGLVAFRGERAEVLLRPTGSVEVARARLAELPDGGRTPLAAGIAAALELATAPARAATHRPLPGLVTDGRATAGPAGSDPVEAAGRPPTPCAGPASTPWSSTSRPVGDHRVGQARLGLARTGRAWAPGWPPGTCTARATGWTRRGLQAAAHRGAASAPAEPRPLRAVVGSAAMRLLLVAPPGAGQGDPGRAAGGPLRHRPPLERGSPPQGGGRRAPRSAGPRPPTSSEAIWSPTSWSSPCCTGPVAGSGPGTAATCSTASRGRLRQAEEAYRMAQQIEGIELQAVIHLQVGRDELRRRLLARARPGRARRRQRGDHRPPPRRLRVRDRAAARLLCRPGPAGRHRRRATGRPGLRRHRHGHRRAARGPALAGRPADGDCQRGRSFPVPDASQALAAGRPAQLGQLGPVRRRRCHPSTTTRPADHHPPRRPRSPGRRARPRSTSPPGCLPGPAAATVRALSVDGLGVTITTAKSRADRSAPPAAAPSHRTRHP